MVDVGLEALVDIAGVVGVNDTVEGQDIAAAEDSTGNTVLVDIAVVIDVGIINPVVTITVTLSTAIQPKRI